MTPQNHLPNIIAGIAGELALPRAAVERTVTLLDEGNTIPFIARYRKEVTGGMDEDQLRKLESRLGYLRGLFERKDAVIRSISEQGKLTPELEAQIHAATTLQEVEDLYLPYRPKRRTRASIAREKGLEPLAQLILQQPLGRRTLEELAQPYLTDAVPSAEAAWAGARDIVAEMVSEDAVTRQILRELFAKKGELLSDVSDESKDAGGKYRDYYTFGEPLAAIPPHRLLALRRGEKEEVLKTRLEVDAKQVEPILGSRFISNPKSALAGQLDAARSDAYDRLIEPSVEREALNARQEEADAHAITLFAANLRQLLLQSPLRGRRIMGVDPGYRTGCKVAVVDETGRYLAGVTIYPHPPANKAAEARQILAALARQHRVDIIAIGNGTASRETEALAAELIETEKRLSYVMVSEAGASVYSASELARDELPDLDVSMRGAVSIARRLQDPLAELVKIEPRAIGVGLYQHDVDQKRLGEALDAVVESAVNHVGVDVNTASPALLQYVAGLNRRIAAGVVAHRDEHGPFGNRDGLRKVKGLGPKAFQQSAGFLRVRDGDNRLDNTPIHPESYSACGRLLTHLGLSADMPDLPARVAGLAAGLDYPALARKLDIGEPTLRDMVESLQRPGRDPRDDLPAPILRKDVLSMEDLREGMTLRGTVRNVVDFGAFVDIGVKRDGLVHVSEMADHFVRSPLEVVKVGDIVNVKVLAVDIPRGRINLSMKV